MTLMREATTILPPATISLAANLSLQLFFSGLFISILIAYTLLLLFAATTCDMYYSVLSGSCQLRDDEDDDRASNVVFSLAVYY